MLTRCLNSTEYRRNVHVERYRVHVNIIITTQHAHNIRNVQNVKNELNELGSVTTVMRETQIARGKHTMAC